MEAVESYVKEKGRLINSARCRCCRSIKKCLLLTAEYEFSGKREVYSDMFIDCFGLLLSHIEGEVKDLGICMICVGRLRDAWSFRQQVVKCEQLFLSTELEVKQAPQLDVFVEVNTGTNVAKDNRHDPPLPDDTLNIHLEVKSEAGGESETDEEMDDTDDPDFPGPQKKRPIQKIEEYDVENHTDEDDGMIESETPPKKKSKPASKTETDKEHMILTNAATLVHSSYICPFLNQLNMYCCYYCREQFAGPSELREHTLTHDPEMFESSMEYVRMPKIDITRIDCRLCAEQIDDLTTLRSHLKTAHGKEIFPVTNEFLTYKLLTADSVMCAECNATFPYFDLLQKHVNKHYAGYPEEGTPPDSPGETQTYKADLLPEKSRSRYMVIYAGFMSWKKKTKAKSFSEDVVLAYFQEMSGKYKPSSLWATYSMLKCTLKSKHDIDLKDYLKLNSFLKQQSRGFSSKTTKQLTAENVERFLNEAPDDKYLLLKVILIFGITGACKRQELVDITTDDIETHGQLILVKIHENNKIVRTFTLHGKFYKYVKKYEALRVTTTKSKRFFQNYLRGKCTRQVVGVNKIGNVPKEIAKYLKLPNPEAYTSHSFRRTSNTLIYSRSDVMRNHKRWRFSNDAEGNTDDRAQDKETK